MAALSAPRVLAQSCKLMPGPSVQWQVPQPLQHTRSVIIYIFYFESDTRVIQYSIFLPH